MSTPLFDIHSLKSASALFVNSYHALRSCHEYVPPWRVILAFASLALAISLLVEGRRDSATVLLTLSLVFFTGVMLLDGHRYYCGVDTFGPPPTAYAGDVAPDVEYTFTYERPGEVQ